ncbi:hypothetical protein ACQ4PT_044416 [Festuca glaucescens]
MALRSLLRKMPALSLRSPPMGRPVRALSPAAGSRFMSHGGGGLEEELIIQEELAQMRAETNRKFYRDLAEMSEIRHRFGEIIRAGIEEDERTRKTLKLTEMASNAVIILSVPASLYMLNYF